MQPDNIPSQQKPFRRSRTYWMLGAGLVVVALVAGIFALNSKDQTVKQAPTSNDKSSTSTHKPQSDEALVRAITPCELLTGKERAVFGLETGEADNKHIRGCDWDKSGSLYTHASIYPSDGMEKFERDDASSQPLMIGSHQARLIVPHKNSPIYGTCEAVVAIGSNKSASVVITANGPFSKLPDQAKYCNIVKQLATYIQAKLP